MDGRAAAALDSLVRKELIRQQRNGAAADDTYRFRHVLIRNAAYDALPKQVRAELHERFADWLESSAGVRQTEVEEVLGYHLEQAFRHRAEVRGMDDISRGLAVRGGRQLAAAGRRAVARGDAPAAVNLSNGREHCFRRRRRNASSCGSSSPTRSTRPARSTAWGVCSKRR